MYYLVNLKWNKPQDYKVIVLADSQQAAIEAAKDWLDDMAIIYRHYWDLDASAELIAQPFELPTSTDPVVCVTHTQNDILSAVKPKPIPVLTFDQVLRSQLAKKENTVSESTMQRYRLYLECADNGRGGDITRNGQPLLLLDEWLRS